MPCSVACMQCASILLPGLGPTINQEPSSGEDEEVRYTTKCSSLINFTPKKKAGHYFDVVGKYSIC